MAASLWSIVLAAGNGRRLAPVTQGVPKQYWKLDGRSSLLDETFARIATIAPPARTRHYVSALGRCWPARWVVYQPEDRGTAAGVLLAITPVLDATREGIVLLTPCDHAVADVARFQSGIRAAVAAVRSGSTDAVLFGVEPSEAVTDYGWIVPGSPCGWANGQPFRRVSQFVEKPMGELAVRLFRTGAVWNTMVLVARAATLLRLYDAHLPLLSKLFATYRRLAPQDRGPFLCQEYTKLLVADFSRDIMRPTARFAVYSWRQALGWSDLGTPDRLRRWLHDEGMRTSIFRPTRRSIRAVRLARSSILTGQSTGC